MNKISMRNYMVTITRMLVAGTAILLTAHGVSSVNPRSLSGVVQTGGTTSNQPLPNVNVTLFEATTGEPAMLGEAITDGIRRGCRCRPAASGSRDSQSSSVLKPLESTA